MEKSRPNKIACADGTGPRETRETIVIVNAVESRGAAFFPRRHTQEKRRRRRWKTQRQHVHMFGIRTSGQREGEKQEKEGRERKGVVPPTCCRMWLLNKKPQREKKKKKSPYISPACVLPVPAVGWLAGWRRRRRRFDRSIQQNTGETLNTGHVVSERLIGCRDDCGAGNPPPTPSCLHAMPPLG